VDDMLQFPQLRECWLVFETWNIGVFLDNELAKIPAQD
jgi:hypothetical protein